MSEEVADAANSVCSCSIEVCGPGQACVLRSFGRVDLFRITEFTWVPDVDVTCVRPLNAAPLRSALPHGGSLMMTGIVDTEGASAEGRTAIRPCGHCIQGQGPLGARAPLR
jgi:hypothetical protein